jgi:hypothetical protein
MDQQGSRKMSCAAVQQKYCDHRQLVREGRATEKRFTAFA